MTGKRVVGSLGPYPWFAVWATHLDHPKADALVHKLGGDPRVALHISAVWGFFSQKYPEGVMPDEPFAIAALERWARWPGEGGKLVAAMIAVGLLERRRKRISVHDWAIHQEAHAERRARDRAYQAQKRAELKGKARHDVGTTSAAASTSSSPFPSPSASQGEATSLRSVPIIEGRAAASPGRPITPVPPPTRAASAADPWSPLSALYSKLHADQRGAFTREEQAAKQRVEARARDGVTVDAWRNSPEYRSAAEVAVHAIIDRWQPLVGTNRLSPVGTGLGGGAA